MCITKFNASLSYIRKCTERVRKFFNGLQICSLFDTRQRNYSFAQVYIHRISLFHEEVLERVVHIKIVRSRDPYSLLA